MNKNQKRITVVVVIVFIAYSIMVFALPFKVNSIFWLSYVFSIISIGLQLYIMKIAFAGAKSVESKFYGFPIMQIGLTYMGLQLLVSIAVMIWETRIPIWLPVIIYALLLAVSAIGLIASDTMRDELERQDMQTQKEVSCISTLTTVVYSLVMQCQEEETKIKVRELADEFRYSDPVSGEELKSIEEDLENMVAKIQNAIDSRDQDSVVALCEKTRNILIERNRLAKLSK